MEEKEKLHYLQIISYLYSLVSSVFSAVISIRAPAALAKTKAFPRSNGHFLSLCDMFFSSYRRSNARRLKRSMGLNRNEDDTKERRKKVGKEREGEKSDGGNEP